MTRIDGIRKRYEKAADVSYLLGLISRLLVVVELCGEDHADLSAEAVALVEEAR